MAAKVSVAPFSHPLTATLHLRRDRTFRCFSKGAPDGGRAPRLLKIAVGGVTEFLRLFTSKKPRQDIVSSEITLTQNVDDVIKILRADFESAYFVTGNFTSDIYLEDCLFEDPTIQFRGKDLYSQNLRLLVPFFDHPSIELEKIEKGQEDDMSYVLATWKLRTYLRFPWRPLISIRGTTTYNLDDAFKIVRHAESWNVSALEAIGQIFMFRPPEDGR